MRPGRPSALPLVFAVLAALPAATRAQDRFVFLSAISGPSL